MGAMSFLTLRDRYGVTQLSDLEGKLTGFLQDIKYEDCIQITGTVIARPDGQENKAMETGEIEVALDTITILGKSKELPFSIVDEPNTSEEIRFKHRYLDIRRRKVLENIKFRAQMNQFTRNWFSNHDFLEVQTPLFTVSSPEGARDFLIPSRVNPGKFYALPQAPQQYKQLLMIGGVDKYFQIAPCFRDEDPRADRHSCEFYQIDVEMSFVHQEDVHAIAQAYIADLIPSVSDKRIIDPVERLSFLASYVVNSGSLNPPPQAVPLPSQGGKELLFPKIPYDVAMDLFGSDKPDLRFDCHMVEVTELFRNSEASFISEPLAQGSYFKAIRLAGHIPTRKEIDAITEVAKQSGAGGLPYISLDAEGLKGSIAKFITPEVLENLKTTTVFAE
jgi:aspartyl-tRNA synthetase